MWKPSQPSSRIQTVALTAALALLAWLVLCRAWMYEDAYITFRTVANFVDGNGLRWNIDHRVQTYTHPLWMLLHIPLYAALGNMHLAGFSLSIGCALASFALLLRRFSGSGIWLWLPLVAIIATSRTFLMYATSGFEVPLTWLLLAGMALALEKGRPGWVCALAGLAVLNRHDLVLIVGPIVALELATRRMRWVDSLRLVVPTLLWLVFATIYYGFALPNTLYAKQSTGAHWLDYANQGIVYGLDILENDPTAGMAFVLAMLLPLLLVRQTSSPGKQRTLVWSVGISLYVAYVIRVGGDHSAFRMWANPAMAALIALGCGLEVLQSRVSRGAMMAALAGSLIAWATLPDYWITGRERHRNKIYLQHQWTYHSTSMENMIRLIRSDGTDLTKGGGKRWLEDGQKLRQEAESAGRQLVRVINGAGIRGYHAGPQLTLIDTLALGDPLLARLPVSPNRRDPAVHEGWRIGHFGRGIPPGYERARDSGASDEMDPALAEYWKALHLITAGPVWNAERLRTVVRFNLGHYDALRDDYVARCIDGGKC